MRRFYRSDKHFVSVELEKPITIIVNGKFQKHEKIIIRNPNEYVFCELDGKCYIFIEHVGAFEVKETINEIAEKLKSFNKVFLEDFDRFIEKTTPESRSLLL